MTGTNDYRAHHDTAMKVAVVIPELNRSGGVRMAVEMCMRLVAAGVPSRLVVVNRYRASVKTAIKNCYMQVRYGAGAKHWAADTALEVAATSKPSAAFFSSDDIVLSVGSISYERLRSLRGVLNIARWCHGINPHRMADMNCMWSDRIPTAAITENLALYLANLTGQRIPVVANGISLADYFADPCVARDSIGLMYGEHPAKDPNSCRKYVESLRLQLPESPIVSYGSSKSHPGFRPHFYFRYPSVELARKLYSRSIVWACLSNNESFGLPVLEAMACGAAIVTTDYDPVTPALGRFDASYEKSNETPLVRSGVNGIVIPRGDVSAALEATRELLSNNVLREKYVAEGLKTAQSFTWASAAQQMRNFLEHVHSARIAA